jgi:hypothetical protein
MIAATGYDWWVFLHIAGAFGFLMAHGVSAGIALKLRRERELERIRALLDLSVASVGALYGSLLVLLAGGIVAGFVGHWWGSGWIWTALGVLVALMVAMYALASTYYNRVREAAGVQNYDQRKKGIDPGPPAPPEELAALLRSARPLVIAGIGFAGLLLILWLMVLKPF